MTIVAMRNGLVTTIQNYGKWSASQISTCDFGIAELAASVVVLQPQSIRVTPLTHYASTNVRHKMQEHNIFGVVMVKDTGNPTQLLADMWTAVDDIYNSVNSDDTLNGAVKSAYIAEISRPSIDSFIEGQGQNWGYLTFRVVGQEY